MTLNELLQVKKDREQGIIISPQTWMRVLETAIAKRSAKQIHSQEFHELAMDYRAASTLLANERYNDLTAHIEKWHMEE